MSGASRRHLYGPVLSRRLGRSLGVDLIPPKTCTMDCLYCQVGRTTDLTVTRAAYKPTEDVMREIEAALAQSPALDYITLSGSGEPTLHVGFGKVIEGIKKLTDIPVAITTNSSLFSDPAVRDDCMRADLVLPSLDAADARMFSCVNRPHRDIDFDEMVEGLAEFRRGYAGEIWLEVLLLYGVTGVPAYVRLMRPVIERLGPDKIQLNTAVRAPAGSLARSVPDPDLRALASLLGPRAEALG